MSISEMEKLLKTNPDFDLLPAAPALVDIYTVQGMGKKVPSDFKNLLKRMKQSNSKGKTKSTINTHNITEI